MKNIGDLKPEHLVGFNDFYFGVYADILNICKFASGSIRPCIEEVLKFKGKRDLESCTEYFYLIDKVVAKSGNKKDYGSSYVIHQVVYPFVSDFIVKNRESQANSRASQLKTDIEKKSEELNILQEELAELKE